MGKGNWTADPCPSQGISLHEVDFRELLTSLSPFWASVCINAFLIPS